MEQLLYNLINSNTFWFFLISWLLICLIWKTRRDRFIERLAALIAKPIIFEKDTNPGFPPLFPRSQLEGISQGIKNGLINPLVGIVVGLTRLLKSLWERVYNPERPWRIAGYIFFFLTLLVFIYADAIAIVNGLDAFGMLGGEEVPAFLLNYSIAVTMGSLFSVVIGALIFKEIYSSTSQFSDWEDNDGQWKQFGKMLSVALIMGGLLVVVTLGLLRLDAFSNLRASLGPSFEAFANTIITILVPLNTVLGTALIFEEGLLKGGALVALLVGVVLLGAFHLLNYVLKIIAYVGPFLLDLIFRAVYFVVDLIFYIITTPLDGVVKVLTWPFRALGGEQSGKDLPVPKKDGK